MFKKMQAGFTIIEAMMLVAMLAGVVGFIGWCMNIYWVIQHINDTVTGIVMLHWVGIPVAPLGAVLGLFF